MKVYVIFGRSTAEHAGEGWCIDKGVFASKADAAKLCRRLNERSEVSWARIESLRRKHHEKEVAENNALVAAGLRKVLLPDAYNPTPFVEPYYPEEIKVIPDSKNEES